MKNRFFQLLSIILVFVMLFNMFPLQVFAEEQQKATADVSVSDTVPKDVRIAEEKIHKRTEYSKEFHLNNGLSMAVVYPEAVHYQDGGQWKEIDNTLQLSTDGSYTNAAGLWDVRFPQQLTSSNGISITKDGYTLSFAMAGEVVSSGELARTGENETLSVSGAQASTARVETVDNTEMKNAAEYPETVPDKLKSRLTYSGVYQNTNVIYDLDSNKVKESIVLSRYNSALSGYRYTLQVGSLIPVLEESGQILFFTPDKKEVVMVMPAPYLVDADNVYNTDVQVTLTGSGSTYTLTYTLPKTWLAAQDRAWPVVLDPMVTPTMSTSNIKDRTVAENVTYSAGSGILECGYSTQYGVERIYLQYAGLPALTGSQTVVSASIQMYKVLDSVVEIPVEVHKVNAAWDSTTITWANKPGYNSIVEDYKLVKNEGFYAWEITNIVRGWYENGNTGMMFKAPNSAEQAGTNNWKQFCSSDYSDYHNLKPLLVITFRDNKGIEPYYSYQTMSAGLSGTAYVADATGQLKVTKQVASYHSEVNPFQLNLVYNSDYFAQNANANDPIQSTHNIDMYFGKGFTLDMIQTVEPAGLENALYTYLVYHDGDGTDHYFRKQDDGTYLDEDGLGLTITVSQSDYIMTDDQGNTWKFTDGILTEQTDEYGNKIRIAWQESSAGYWFYNIYQKNAGEGTEIPLLTVTYVDGTSYVNTITDAAGRKLRFVYDSGWRLTNIYQWDPQTQTETRIAKYDYSGRRLIGMRDMVTGYQLWYEYTSGKISSIQEWTHSNYSGAWMDVTYKPEQTIYHDYGIDRTVNTADDLWAYYSFDYAGRTVNTCVKDKTGKILGASTSEIQNSETGNLRQNNRTTRIGSTGAVAQNLMTNGGFETGSNGWTFSGLDATASIAPSSYTAHSGTKSLEGHISTGHTETVNAYIAWQLTANTTYTFSAYVDTSWIDSFGDGGIRLRVANNAGDAWRSAYINRSTAHISDKWERISVTFTPETTDTYVLAIQAIDVQGWFYVDDVLLEVANAPSNYNLIPNGNMASSAQWLYQGQESYVFDGANRVLQLIGDPNTETCAWQNIPISKPGTQTYLLSGWAWADSVPDNEDVKTGDQYPQDTVKRFGLQARITYSDGTYEYHYTPFCPDIHTWQYASLTIVPKQPAKTVSSIQVVLAYEKNANSVWFDDISLVIEPAQTMRYDDEGNLISVTTTGLEKNTATYENGNLIQSYTGGSGTYDYTYDNTKKHQLNSVSDGVVKQSYGYNTKGNMVSTTVQKSDGTGKKLTTAAEYSANGNLLKKVTDANGSHVWYYYDTALSQMTGAATQVCTAPAGTTDETAPGIQWRYTRSVYDGFGRITQTSVANKATTGYNDSGMTLDPTVNYSYDSEGNLSTVERTAGDVTQHYIFAYDIWGNRTSVAVGANRTLASYAYGAGNGNLQTMTYGNGDAISYTYDTLGRVCTATYKNAAGDTTRVLTYTYTGDGQLYAIYDSATENTTYYTYDSLGRLIASTDNSVRINATYNAYNQLISQRFSSPIYTATETYTYDTNTTNGYSDGVLTGMTMVSGHSTIYTYDSLQRLTQRHINSGKTGGGMWECYTYRDGSATNTTTTRVHSKENWLNNKIKTNSLYFEYDVIGNITKETRHTYSIPASSEIAQNVADRTVSTIHYTYDALGQLTGVTHSDGRTEAYTYDKAGNILTFNNGSGISHSMAYTDSQWKDLLTAVGNQTITYDAIGNPINYYNGYTFTWAEGRRLQSATVGENQTYGYQYNADGLRIKKTNADGSYIVYHIAGSRYLGEIYYTATGAVDLYIRYNYDENGSVVGISLWNAGGSAWTDYYFEKNLQGDILNVYQDGDSLPTLVASYTYDAWGNILTSIGSATFDGRYVKDLNPFRYRGYYYDAETEFYYLQSRYYDPAIGRFINADGYVSTGQDIAGFNMFAYCGNNPVIYFDLSGESFAVILGFNFNIFGWGVIGTINFVSTKEEFGVQVSHYNPDDSKNDDKQNQTTGVDIGPYVGVQYTEKNNMDALEGQAKSTGGDLFLGGDILTDENGNYLGWQFGASGFSANMHSLYTDTTTVFSLPTIDLPKIVVDWALGGV